MPTAAILLIGNELLSGKIRDENASWLAGRLRSLGVSLRHICVVPDEPPAIIEALHRLHPAVDHLFTSGGVGPTHDDITLPTVAAAFGVGVQRDAELAGIIAAHFGERLRPEHLRMADVPEGSVLLWAGAMRWPVYTFRNIYILPGVPQIFRAKFDGIADRFASGAFYLRSLYLDADEGAIAAHLAYAQANFAVMVGSYPRIDDAGYRVRVTVEAKASAAVNTAVTWLCQQLTPAQIVRVDDPVTAAAPDAEPTAP